MASRRVGESQEEFNTRVSTYQRERRQERLWEARVFLGETCVRCDRHMDEVTLELDHIDPYTKEFSPARAASHVSEDRWWEEVQKCQLLCFECHVEKSCNDGSRYKGRRRKAAA